MVVRRSLRNLCRVEGFLREQSGAVSLNSIVSVLHIDFYSVKEIVLYLESHGMVVRVENKVLWVRKE